MRPVHHTETALIAGEKPPSPLGRHVVVDLETRGFLRGKATGSSRSVSSLSKRVR